MWPTEGNLEAWEKRFGPRDGPVGLADAVRERLPKLEGKHVMHLPCGTGGVAAELTQLGALVSGIDPSDANLAAARERAPDAAFFQAELDELPLQFRRNRFNLVLAGEGALAGVRELGPFASAVAAALRKNGRLILYDWHPVVACIDPIDLRWRSSYFAEGLWRVGDIAVAFGSILDVTELAELPAGPTDPRADPRLPAHVLLSALKRSQDRPSPAPRRSI
jgi:SAM-dependent methyltransferase